MYCMEAHAYCLEIGLPPEYHLVSLSITTSSDKYLYYSVVRLHSQKTVSTCLSDMQV